MRRIPFLLVLTAAVAFAADLPVRQVVLYKHGVGFFERAGRLGPGESARLDFDASEMNDVLKSLVIEEQGGARISGLRYDSMDPLSHKLAEFPFQIEGGQSLAAMFDQLKGSRAELKLGNDTVAGAIVSGRVVDMEGKPIAGAMLDVWRVHRFERRQTARRGGQLHDSDSGVEIELSADFRRQGTAGAGRLGHRRQHYRRGLD